MEVEVEVEEGMEWRLYGFEAEVLSDEYRDSIPVADVGVMSKHYEVRLECYHLESSNANAAVEGVEHCEEQEAAAAAAAVASPSTSAEGVVGPVKAHASVPSLVSDPAPWLLAVIFSSYHISELRDLFRDCIQLWSWCSLAIVLARV